MYRNLLPFFLLLCLFTSCAFEDASTVDMNTKPFFDLKGYIQGELDEARWEQRTVTKTVTLDGAQERQQLDNPDLSKDLALFSKADINKPAWVDKYRLETEGNDTTYIALDSSLFTQRLQVIRDEAGTVERLEILRRTGNLLSSGQQELSYRPASGYRIASEQIGDLVGSASLGVEVAW